ncbi:hypothetical protein [uncultured Corynebacterium sp.]|uniref:hypothetical protein n=1 Tax=uncultured Corynebacterium sp. TaxID=159447 RepID=UPI002803D4E2|nr:hypothetical protein [uncultured Corynebacterium sp.]
MTELHVVEPVTIDRLAQLCELIDADYALIEAAPEEGDARGVGGDNAPVRRVLQTGVPHIAVHCDLNAEGDVLSAFAAWEGTLPAHLEQDVAAAVAELNWASVAPTLNFLVEEDAKGNAEIHLGANRAMAVGEGLSLAQLGHFLLSSLASFAEIFDVVAQRFPQAVTWNEEE